MTARDIFNGSTGNRATILILDSDGLAKTGVAFNASGLSISYRINTGSPVSITLTSGNWFEVGGGKYLVDVADSVYAAGNIGALVQFYGALTASSVYGEQHRVVAYNPLAVAVGANTTTPPTAASIADATLSSATSGPSTGGNWPNNSIGRMVLIGASTQREVAVTGSNHVAADIHELQPAVITSGDFATDAISANAVSSGAVTKIVTGVWSALTSGLSVVGSTGRALARLIGLVQDSGGDRFTAKALEEAPTGGGGSGQYAITLVASSTSGNVRGVVFSIVGTATRVETGTSGQAVMNIDAGTYTLRTTPPSGWEPVADSSLVVAADATVTKTLTAVGYTPSNPPGCTVTIPVRSQYTTALAGVEVKLKFIAWDAGATKPATILSPPPIQTSDASGVVTVVLYRQAKYTATYTIPGDTVRVVPFTVPNSSTYTVVEP